jgi:hypothetical protein
MLAPNRVAELGSKIDQLSDSAALWAVDHVGRTIAAQRGIAPTVLDHRVRALDGLDISLVPVIEGGKVAGGPEELRRAGVIARYALRQGLSDPRDGIGLATAAAIDEAAELQKPQGPQELFTILAIGGVVLLGLAALAKLEITAEGKVILHPGLPDIDKAGKAVGELIRAAANV